MSNSISFPKLPFIYDKVFEIDRIALSFGSFSIKWYGVILALSFVIAAIYIMRRSRSFGTNPDTLVDMLLWTLPISVIGARIYFVVHKWDYYSANPGEIYRIWNGGIAIYGAVIAGVVTIWLFCRRRRLDILSMLDLCVLGLLIGQFIGRWANFINAEAYGTVTGLPWGMSINGGEPVHPTFFYESFWNFIGFIALHFYSKRRRFRGEIFLLYVAWYGLGRAFIEGLRTDSLYIGSTDIRVSQVLAAVSCVCAAGLLVYFHVSKKYPKKFVPAEAAPIAEKSVPEAEAAAENAPAEESEKEGEADGSDNN